jgi:hypothetical protein
MTVAMMVDNPAGSQELYEALRAELRFDGPLGGAVHIAGPSPNGGWRVIEIFDSSEAASRFLRERFAPALAKLGFSGEPPKPELWPVHACLTTDRVVTGT